jgi:hypothetical protein
MVLARVYKDAEEFDHAAAPRGDRITENHYPLIGVSRVHLVTVV